MTATRQAHTIEYANARIRGHRVKLFTAEDFERFLNLESLDSFLVTLGGTKYKRDLENNLALHREVTAIGYASSDYLLKEFHFIANLLSDNQAKGVQALGSYWDFSDFKMVIRGVHSGASREDIVKSFRGPGITITREQLAILASQDSLEELISLIKLMKISFFADMRAESEVHIIPEAFAEFEVQLDKTFFEATLNGLSKGAKNELARNYFIAQINKRNLMTLVRMIRSDIHFDDADDANTYFLKGGSLVAKAQTFKSLSDLGDLDELVKKLKGTSESGILKAELPEYYLSGSLSSLDRALDTALLKMLVHTGKRDLFGNGIAVAYLLSLENEVRNLRLIAHGKSFGIGADEIRREFILL